MEDFETKACKTVVNMGVKRAVGPIVAKTTGTALTAAAETSVGSAFLGTTVGGAVAVAAPAVIGVAVPMMVCGAIWSLFSDD